MQGGLQAAAAAPQQQQQGLSQHHLFTCNNLALVAIDFQWIIKNCFIILVLIDFYCLFLWFFGFFFSLISTEIEFWFLKGYGFCGLGT